MLSSVIFLLLVTIFCFFTLYFIDLNEITSILNQSFKKNYNENLIYYYETDFQFRCFVSGLFLLVLLSFLMVYRKKILLVVPELSESFKILIRSSKEAFKRQFSIHKRIYTFYFFWILLFSIAIRLYFLDSPIRYDEGFTHYYFTKKPWFLVLSYYDYPNNHIFHTILVKLFISIFGDSVVSLRLTAFVFGIGLIPLSYIYVSKVFNKNAAILAVTFISISSILLSYSVNARGYTIIFCAFIILLILIEMLKKHNDKLIWVLFVTIQVIGIYTIPVMLYISFILYIYFVLSNGIKKENEQIHIPLSRIFLSGLIVLYFSMMLYMPVYLLMGAKVIVANETVQSFSFSYILSNVSENLLHTFRFFVTDLPLIVRFLLVGGIVSSFIFVKQCRYLIISIICFFFFIHFIQRVIPPPRVLAILFPVFYIFSAVGIISLVNKFWKLKMYPFSLVLSFCVLIFASFLIIKSNSPTEKFDVTPIRNYNPVFSYLKTEIGLNDRVLCRFPIESSVNSYFYFYKIPHFILQNNVLESKNVFIIKGNKYLQSTDFILRKNDVNIHDFNKLYTLISKKNFDSAISILKYRRK